ncbi:MAG: chemotaxis protein CheB [Polycyclovorans sp.]|tara:strand:+ start:21259 stop:21861 length:603 start_codon:yes stop_codon:yes gene_type:complete
MSLVGAVNAAEAVVMGCSAGGLHALKVVLATLRPARKVPILVVCHTASDDLQGLARLLEICSAWPVREARERERPEPGVVQLAPSGYHLLVEPSGELSLSVDGRVSFARPSIDVLFETAAMAYGPRLIGVIMTGANHDGARGLAAIRQRGGIAIVETPATAEVATMPQAALTLAGADHQASLERMGALITQLIDPRPIHP